MATELENRAEGMVNGIVRVSNKVQRYAKHTVAQWATVTQTEEEEDGAALHVILAPTGIMCASNQLCLEGHPSNTPSVLCRPWVGRFAAWQTMTTSSRR